MARIVKLLRQLFFRLPLSSFADFRLETALSTEFKTENGASVLVFLAVKKRKSTPAFFAAGHEKRALKELIDHSEARFKDVLQKDGVWHLPLYMAMFL